MEFIFIGLFIVVMIGFAVFNFYSQKEKRQKRTAVMAEIATDLGAEYRETHPELAALIKELMTGAKDGKVYDSLRFSVGDGELFLVEYEHLVQYEEYAESASESGIVIPILSGRGKSIPFFSLQKKTRLDGLGRLFGWGSVELSRNAPFNEQMGLSTKLEHVDGVRAFFDQHEQLAEFCLQHQGYHLVCDGRSLVFFRPGQHIKAEFDLFREQLDLGKQLYGAIWPLRA